MAFFICNNCSKRSRRRASSSGDEENNIPSTSGRQRTSLRRGSGGSTIDCCTTAVMYFYARRLNGRSRSASHRSAVNSSTTKQISLDLPRLHKSSSSPKCHKGSILKNVFSPNEASTSPASRSGVSTDNNGVHVTEREPVIRRSSSPDKRASFNEAVDVIEADETGRPVVADSVRLKPPSCVWKDSGNDDCESERAETGGRRRTRNSGGEAASSSRKTGSAPSQPRPMYVYPPASRCRHAFSLASTDVERRPDGTRYLRAVIRPATGPGRDGAEVLGRSGVGTGEKAAACDSDRMWTHCRSQSDGGRVLIGGGERVVVRAGAKGSRLVVGAYKPEPLGDGTNYLRQYIDRFPLPHVIETQTIRADMQPTGVLVITAAINESSDTDTD